MTTAFSTFLTFSLLFSTFSSFLNFSQLQGWAQTFADKEGISLTPTNFRTALGFLMKLEKVENS